MKLLHVSARVRGVGGIETLLRRHATADAAHGFDAWQIGLFDRRPGGADEPYRAKQFGWRSTPAGMRHALAADFAARAGSVVVWHNAWGLPWFADLEGAARRIVVLHANRVHFERWLPGLRDRLDGVLTVNPAAARAVAELLPGFPVERIGTLTLPIAPPEFAPSSPPRDATWVIGGAGRLERAQKRWDRLLPFVAELHRLGVKFRVEIVGDGALASWLRRQFRGDPAVKLLGFVPDDDYRRRIQSWDAAVFFSDVEGGPIVLLETMAAGVLPIYPSIGETLGDEYAPQLSPHCFYPAGDPVAAARGLRDLLALPPAEIAGLRAKARALAAPHRAESYDRDFRAFVQRVAVLPRISGAAVARRPRWTDGLPLGAITRLWPDALWR